MIMVFLGYTHTPEQRCFATIIGGEAGDYPVAKGVSVEWSLDASSAVEYRRVHDQLFLTVADVDKYPLRSWRT